MPKTAVLACFVGDGGGENPRKEVVNEIAEPSKRKFVRVKEKTGGFETKIEERSSLFESF